MSVATELAGGRFRLERRLGSGGMASVFLAHDAELDRRVAVKLLAEHIADDGDAHERFLREARLAARLSHPNIVSVFDVGDDGGRPYIVMEYVEGSTLAELVAKTGRLAPARAVEIAIQVCAGLEHAHAAGLVHRDVKPQNLLVQPDGRVKIADFGIAHAIEATRVTQAGTILGTAAYLAPEQVAGEPVTAAADLYSLGVVLYELLTGQTPYTVDSLAQLVLKSDGTPIAPVRDAAPDVPVRLEDAVMRSLARRPEYRAASAAELARELADAVPEAPTERLPEPTGVLAREVTTASAPTARYAPVDRRRIVWATAVAVAAALGAVVIAVATAGGGDEPSAPPAVEPVPQAEDPAQRARNLAEWLREHAAPPR